MDWMWRHCYLNKPINNATDAPKPTGEADERRKNEATCPERPICASKRPEASRSEAERLIEEPLDRETNKPLTVGSGAAHLALCARLPSGPGQSGRIPRLVWPTPTWHVRAVYGGVARAGLDWRRHAHIVSAELHPVRARDTGGALYIIITGPQ